MAIKIKVKNEIVTISPSVQRSSTFCVPTITPPKIHTPNIIIRAIKIMLMDIRMLVLPKQTKEELEKYSQFADLVYRRK
jgi:hypothetical protein